VLLSNEMILLLLGVLVHQVMTALYQILLEAISPVIELRLLFNKSRLLHKVLRKYQRKPGRKNLQVLHPLSPTTTKDDSAKIAPLHLPAQSSSEKLPDHSTPTTSNKELDPARKIWSDMRKNSKGTRPAFSIKTLTDGFSADDGYMDLERQRIKEQAVRNKRSLGADTLRSMVGESEGVREGGNQEVLGERMGGWVGWGPPWW